MSGSIGFSEIPLDWRVPGSLVEIRPDYQTIGVLAWPAKVLILGQMITGNPGLPNVPVRLTRVDDAIARWGAGSQLAQMAAAWLLINTTTEVWMMAVADPAGVKASGTITFAGTPTAAGTIGVYVGGRRLGLSVATTDTATTIAARLVSLVTADTSMPVAATNAAAVVTLTCKHFGTLGNLIDVRLNRSQDEATPAGVTATLVAMTGGTLEPDLPTALSAVASDWYTDLVLPSTGSANVSAMVTELARRYTATGRLDMHAYAGQRGTYSALTTFGTGLNSPFLTVVGANASPTNPWVWATALAAVSVFQLSNDPARQLRGLTLAGVLPPDPTSRFIDSERDGLLRSGISTFNVASDGSVVLERVITTYQKTSLSVADTAWLDITVPKVTSRIRYDWATYTTLTYPRSKLADDGSLAAEVDTTIVTPRRLHGSWGARCRLYARNGWIENEAITVAASFFQRNATDRNRVDARLKIDIIGNVMILAAALEFQS